MAVGGDTDVRRPAWRRDGETFVADLGGPVATVRFLAEDIVRIRAAPDGVFRPRRSWAVTPPDETFAPVETSAEAVGGALRLVSRRLTVDLGEGRIGVRTAEGRELLAAVPGGLAWEDGRVTWTTRIPSGRGFYGLGERTGMLDKRGRRYTCWTTDEWRHQGPETDALYVAVPFLLALDATGRAFGVFLHTTFRSTFDLSDVDGETLTLAAEGGELDAYVLDGPAPAAVLERFTGLVGRAALPPRWALGYHQSRWGYDSAETVLGVARELRRRRIPADAMHLDIDHTDGCRVFTWDSGRFPDPPKLVGELARLGFRTVCLVSAGVKHEPDGGYHVYDEGRRCDAFLRGSDGEELRGWVWPGLCVYPDHLRPDVREWWGGLYRPYVEAGVDGFLNDMNEPAMHDRPMEDDDTDNAEPPGDTPHGALGERVTHAEARNVYALLQAAATDEALRRQRPGMRPFLLTRAGFAGVQRHAGVWTGDQGSWWEHLEMSLPLVLNVGLSGIPLVGSDIGGFFASCDGELLVRWMQLGALYPFARNHSAKDSAPQEPWAHGPEVEAACRRALELRYRLLPYLYGLFEEATRIGAPVLRPLFFHYADDPRTHRLSDQALLGRDLLVAPVVRPGVVARAVYLPAGLWYDLDTSEVQSGRRWTLAHAPLDRDVPLFARGGSVIPAGPALQWTDERALEPLSLTVYLDEDGRADGRLYEDDGVTMAHLEDGCCVTRFSFRGRELFSEREGAYEPPERAVVITVYGEGAPCTGRVERDTPSWRAAVT